MKTKEPQLKTNLESFRKLRSLKIETTDWFKLRNEICEENLGLAYYVVNKAASGFLNSLTGGTRDSTLYDLRQIAFIELLRVVTVYDPERTHPLEPEKHIEFATFAYKNLLFKVRDHCKVIAERLDIDVSLTDSEDDEESASMSDILAAELSPEAIEQLVKEMRSHYFTRISDPLLKARLESTLNKLKYGDNVTLFERQFLCKLIADPNVVLTPPSRAMSGAFMVSDTHESGPLRRYRSWRQILS